MISRTWGRIYNTLYTHAWHIVCIPHKAEVVCTVGSPEWAGKTVEGRSNADLDHGVTKSQARGRLDTIMRFQTAVSDSE
jgi:hypothetical protein